MSAFFPSNIEVKPLKIKENRAYFLQSYEDTWQIAHGSLQGFDPEGIYTMYALRAASSPRSMQGLWADGTLCGLLALDEQRGRLQRYLWVAFLHIDEAFRGRGLGRELIRAAEARAKELGRRELQLCAARTNPSMGFYEKLDFHVCGTEQGAVEPLLRLKRPITK